MFFKNKKFGYSLVEMIIYVSLLTLVSVLVINTILSFTGSYRDLLVLRRLDHSGMTAMERITRDIRNSSSVDVANSVFSSSPGVLTLVDTEDGVSTTTKFYIDNGILKVDVNGVYYGPVTISNVFVSSLSFMLFDNGVSQAVKLDMTLNSTSKDVSKTKNYHSTIILRGS